MSELGFRIEGSRKAFEILSEKLYKDKILAVIREICCNAYDAHVEAGREHMPFDVHLPNAATQKIPHFKVRDYGNGLSSEQVEEIFTVFFRSTKTNDNTQTGNFGLGAKTPFAVVDAFSVVSFQNGTKTEYLCKKKDGIPAIECLSVNPTTEKDGLEISMNVDLKNFKESLWMEKAIVVLDAFKIAPKCNVSLPYSIDNPEYSHGDRYEVLPNSCNGIMIQMGNIRYPLVCTMLPKFHHKHRDLLSRMYMYSTLVIHIPQKSIEITGSREEISYDEKTVEFLENYVDNVFNSYKQTVTKDVDTQPSFGKTISRYVSLARSESRNIMYDAIDSSFWTYRGKILLIGKNHLSLDLKTGLMPIMPVPLTDTMIGVCCDLENRDNSGVSQKTLLKRSITSGMIDLWLISNSDINTKTAIIFALSDVKTSESKAVRSVIRKYRELNPKHETNRYRIVMIYQEQYELFKNAFGFTNDDFIPLSSCDIVKVISSKNVAKPAKIRTQTWSYIFRKFTIDGNKFNVSLSNYYVDFDELVESVMKEHQDTKQIRYIICRDMAKDARFPDQIYDSLGNMYNAGSVTINSFFRNLKDDGVIYILRDTNNTTKLIDELMENDYECVDYLMELKKQFESYCSTNEQYLDALRYECMNNIISGNLKFFGQKDLLYQTTLTDQVFDFASFVDQLVHDDNPPLPKAMQIITGQGVYGSDPLIHNFNQDFEKYFGKKFIDMISMKKQIQPQRSLIDLCQKSSFAITNSWHTDTAEMIKKLIDVENIPKFVHTICKIIAKYKILIKPDYKVAVDLLAKMHEQGHLKIY